MDSEKCPSLTDTASTASENSPSQYADIEMNNQVVKEPIDKVSRSRILQTTAHRSKPRSIQSDIPQQEKKTLKPLTTWPGFISFLGHMLILVGCGIKLYLEHKDNDTYCHIEKGATILRFETTDGFLCWLFIFGVVSSGIKNLINTMVETRVELDDLKHPNKVYVHRDSRTILLILRYLQGAVLVISIMVGLILQDFWCTSEDAGARDGVMGGNNTTAGA